MTKKSKTTIETTVRALSMANVSGVLAKLSDAPLAGVLGYRVHKITQAIVPELTALDAARVTAVKALGLEEGENPTPDQEAKFQAEMQPVLDEDVTLDVKPLNVTAFAKALDKADFPLTPREWGMIAFMLED